ncbi:hypothetical protein SLE2022_027660 [Rubroshorea leprosula]
MGEPFKEGATASLPLDHTPVVRLESSHEHGAGELHRFSFAGRLVTTHEDIRSGLVYGILKSAWGPKGGLELHEQSKHTYVFILSDEKEKQRIFSSSPWSVKGFHLILKDWPSSQRFDEIDFSKTEFWVQVHGLPKAAMTVENAKRIGSLFPRLISWDESTLGGQESFLRLRVEIDLHVPLLTGFQIAGSEAELKLAQFKYEKLADFCYRYGMIDHTMKTCEDYRWTDEDRSYISQARPAYGPLLRAPAYSPRRHFGAVRRSPQSLKPMHTINLSSMAPSTATPYTKPPEATAEGELCADPINSRAKRVAHWDDARMTLSSPLSLSPPFNETGLPSSEDYTGCPQSSLCPSDNLSIHAASLNAKETNDNPHEAFGSLKCTNIGPRELGPITSPPKASDGPDMRLLMDLTQVGSILSYHIQTQLHLDAELTPTKKRNRNEEAGDDASKRPKLQAFGCYEPSCSPTQLQEALSHERSVFAPKELPCFFTYVEESVLVHKVRRKIQIKALNRQIRARPDFRFASIQSFHPTQKPYDEPPFQPIVMLVDSAAGNLVTLFSTPSQSTEHTLPAIQDEGVRVAGPRQPPPPP